MDQSYKLAQKQITVPTATPVEVILPAGSKEHLFRFEDLTITYKVATESADAVDGLPFAASEALSIEGPVVKTSIWFYQASGGSVSLHWLYSFPAWR